jgi:thiol:disulfide interchange protein
MAMFSLLAQAVATQGADVLPLLGNWIQFGFAGFSFMLVVALVYLIWKVLDVMKNTNEVITACTVSITKSIDKVDAMQKTIDKNADKLDEINVKLAGRPCICKGE